MLEVLHTSTTALRRDAREQAADPYCRTLIIYDGVAPQRAHAHRFFELLLALDGQPIDIDYGEHVVSSAGHVVPSLLTHRIVRCGPVARLYIAIGMRRVAPLQAGTRVAPTDVRDLREAVLALGSQPSPDASERITLAWQRAWLPGFEDVPRIDPRIERCLRRVNAKSDPKTARETLAASNGLSPSYFGALFQQEMGMPLGRYIIWRRVLIALEYLKAGSTTTQAAVFAGFSDAPHLCRCYRATFGSSPSLVPVGRITQHGDGLKFLTQL